MASDGSGRPAAGKGNAVERVLATADETLALFEELVGPLRPFKGDIHEASHIAKRIAEYAYKDARLLRCHSEAETRYGPARYRDVLTPERLLLMSRWECDNAVSMAADSVAAAGAEQGLRHGNGADLSPQGIVAYCDILAKREALLGPQRWIDLVADVVQESPAWGDFKKTVVKRAEKIQAAVQSLWTLAPKPQAREWKRQDLFNAWYAAREPLQDAMKKLRPLVTPPPREPATDDEIDRELDKQERRLAVRKRHADWLAQQQECIVETMLWLSVPEEHDLVRVIEDDEQAAGPIAELVRRAVKVLAFFDRLGGPSKGWQIDANGMYTLAKAIQADFIRGESSFRNGRSPVYEWESDAASLAAADAAILEAHDSGRRHGVDCDLAPKAIEWYVKIVWYRGRLLDMEKLAYGAGITATAHSTLPSEARDAVSSLARIIRSLANVSTVDQWESVRESLVNGIREASMFCRDSAPSVPATNPPALKSIDLPADAAVPAVEERTERDPSTEPEQKTTRGKGEADTLLKAALVTHHKLANYRKGERLNCHPIGCRALETLARVGAGSATRFFNRCFNKGKSGGWDIYKRLCGDEARLVAILESMDGKVPSVLTYAGARQRDSGQQERA